MWFDPNTIGKCDLEPGERRAPAYLLASQRFRSLDKVNNLEINGARLTATDRDKLIQELECRGDLTFTQKKKNTARPDVRKLLGLTKDDEINLERGGENKLNGNRTFAEFNGVFGERWLAMSSEERDRAVEYVHSFEKGNKLKKAAMNHFQLDEDAAEKLANISFESDYLSHSRKAIRKLLPLLEQGIRYGEARKLAYPKSFQTMEPKPALPGVQEALVEIRNPAVMRSLTELRKVVNAIVRQYGKPTHIRIELARELKKSKKQRVAISENNRRNEASRAKITEKITKEDVGIKEPKPWDIRKALLWDECGGICPYSGKPIPFKSLFGPEPQFDIEHIIPFSISMDNSFQNLTLCHVPENRNAKGIKTPHQAYSGNRGRYEAILERVKHFHGERTMIAAKLRRFEMDDEKLEEFLSDFRDRQLNDTGYASSLAQRYLGLLYGGVVDLEGGRRVHATSGRATYEFRSLWKLNEILNDGATSNGGRVEKKRTDHRHHAIDALVIGLTDAPMIKRLADAAQRAPSEHRRKFASLEGPWPNFTESVRDEVEKSIVSHRVSKKVSGALHEETIYSPPKADGTVRVRKSLASLTKNEVENIVDKSVKTLVIAQLNGGEPKKVFADEKNLPLFVTSDGRRIPIKRARIEKTVATFALGENRTARHVASESNHHLEIYAELDKAGNETGWDGEVVPMNEAYARVKSRTAVVQQDHGPLVKFKFSLAPADIVECDGTDRKRRLWIVRGVTKQRGSPRLSLVPISDARQKDAIVKSGLYWRPFLNPLRKLNPRKLAVSPLGEIREAHD